METFAYSLLGGNADQRARRVLHLRRLRVYGPGTTTAAGRADDPTATGCWLHASYLTARLRWLRDAMPDTVISVHQWMSVGEYIYLQVLGATATGTSTAAWTGMLDRRTGQWDPELLGVCGPRGVDVGGSRSRPAACILPHVDQVLHAVITDHYAMSAEPQNRAQALPKHMERKMMLATARNDDLEDPEAVKALPGMRAHPRNLRCRPRLALIPYGTKVARKA
jgi:FGGY family of carbohydrate kinases, N-terminal domain